MPELPPPPPPPGKKEPAPKPERREVELSPEEETILSYSAKYGNMTPERACMTPELRQVWQDMRDDGLFAVTVYGEESDFKLGRTAYNKDKVNTFGAPSLVADALPSQNTNWERGFLKEKEDKGYVESVILRPVYDSQTVTTSYTEEVPGWFGRTKQVQKERRQTVYKPVPFNRMVKNTDIKDPAVRLTWHVSANEVYRTN